MASISSTSSCLVIAILIAAVCDYYVHGSENGTIGTYELKKGDFSVKFTNWGATIVSLHVPDKNGKLDDIVLGYQSIEEYKTDKVYFGAVVGRVANRIGKAQFSLDGKTYKLAANDGSNALHGGLKGYGDVVWSVRNHVTDKHITFVYHSPDGEEGYPGDVEVKVTYMILGDNKLGVLMKARPLNKPTPINLAQHTYWNLGGHNSGDILPHKFQLFASKTTPTDDQLIPTGELKDIKGTPYDFLEPRTLGSRINELPPNGYDINYVLDDHGTEHMRRVAIVEDDQKSGRKMELWTNQPGVQFYTGNMLEDIKGGKDGAVYQAHAGVCLETQGFPDSVNHPNFPSQIVKPGETYKHVMAYRFTAD